jgi:hypothetical protein
MVATRWFGWAAIVGGVCWVIKGGMILITGDQPPVLFEVAPVLFLIGLLGLNKLLAGYTGLAKTIGILWIYIGLLSMLILGFYAVFSPDSFPDGEEFVFPTSALMMTAGLGSFLGLLGLGWAARQILTPPLKNLPLALGLFIPFSLIIGGILEEMNERLLEVPLLLLALGWIALGYFIWQASLQPT